MDNISQIFNIFLHLNVYLEALAKTYGVWTYGILFLIIFCETGLVITPFLPGDSLLFAAGTIAALGNLNVHLLATLCLIAAILGNLVNYSIGRYVGPKVFQSKYSGWFKQEYLQKTQEFYQKHGGITIIIGRFLPIIRTFVPFVAGVAQMSRQLFVFYTVAGSFLWIGLFVYVSYYFGSIPAVKENFSFVIVGIIILSILPALIEIFRHKFIKSNQGKSGDINES